MSRSAVRTVFVCIGVVAGAPGAQGQNPPQVCQSAEYRQFDFWLGDWVVHDQSGTYQGSNSITQIENRCVLQERWTGASGGTGTSFNIYDFTRGVWHQTWVAGPTLLVIEGRFAAGKMVMEGKTVGSNGAETFQRITWTPVERDRVTQVWEQSPDRVTWTVVFHGIYTRP